MSSMCRLVAVIKEQASPPFLGYSTHTRRHSWCLMFGGGLQLLFWGRGSSALDHRAQCETPGMINPGECGREGRRSRGKPETLLLCKIWHAAVFGGVTDCSGGYSQALWLSGRFKGLICTQREGAWQFKWSAHSREAKKPAWSNCGKGSQVDEDQEEGPPLAPLQQMSIIIAAAATATGEPEQRSCSMGNSWKWAVQAREGLCCLHLALWYSPWVTQGMPQGLMPIYLLCSQEFLRMKKRKLQRVWRQRLQRGRAWRQWRHWRQWRPCQRTRAKRTKVKGSWRRRRRLNKLLWEWRRTTTPDHTWGRHHLAWTRQHGRQCGQVSQKEGDGATWLRTQASMKNLTVSPSLTQSLLSPPEETTKAPEGMLVTTSSMRRTIWYFLNLYVWPMYDGPSFISLSCFVQLVLVVRPCVGRNSYVLRIAES